MERLHDDSLDMMVQVDCGLVFNMADGASDVVHRIASRFLDGVSLAFAYGSGVFKQQGNVSSGNMIDFIFVVEDSHKWHKKNLESNPDHYSFLGSFGANVVAAMQDKLGAGVYYNTLVPCEGRIIKYGTISRDNFLQDTKNWEWLYTSGRLHKPVKILSNRFDDQIASALEANLRSALAASLLCLPESFPEQDLYTSIAGLSYAGDFRMIIGEDKGKVGNIVSSNLEGFRELYRPILSRSTDLHVSFENTLLKQNIETDRTFCLMKSLPQKLRSSILRRAKVGAGADWDAQLHEIAKDRVRCSSLVRQGVTSIVRESSVTQSAKGILSAGAWKTCVYSAEKLRKMFRGLARK